MSDYYTKKKLAYVEIRKMADTGTMSKNQIALQIVERFGFSQKVVFDYINLLLSLGYYRLVADIIEPIKKGEMNEEKIP